MIRRWGRDPFRTGLVQAVEGAARQAVAISTTPGLAMALVQHGQVVWAAGYGVADPRTCWPVTAATRFQAASLSKPVTAWGVLRLVEWGRIGLDEPIVGHLWRWPAHQASHRAGSAQPGRSAAGAHRRPGHRGPLGARLRPRAPPQRRPARLP